MMQFTFPELLIIVAGSVAAVLAQSLPMVIGLAALVWVALTGYEWWQQRH